ncbi:hypothetical protein ACGFIG_09425 [Micromonospora sp. NPDC049048]|uniref:hypothetical protein n=1 Tax=Micromonospora sp. NPDC049048 TaxID=3364263 RepID=UPI00371611F7
MPNQPKTPIQRFRLDAELWKRFGEVARPTRSAVLVEFVRWYLRERGAKMPVRPDVTVDAS